MGEELDRDELLRLLEELGGERDADVLAAARDLQAMVEAAGLDWDDLLASDLGRRNLDEAHDGDRSVDGSPSAFVGAKDAETLALIDKLLARPNCSDGLREELDEYKTDIAEGQFDARDHDYVRALYNRLTN